MIYNYNLENLFFDGYDYSVLSKIKEESTDREESVDLSEMLPLEDDPQEVKEGRGL